MLFYVGVYKDQALAKELIHSLQTHYPDSTIFSISDGIVDPDYEIFCLYHGVYYVVGERLKIPVYAGRWTERFLRAFLQTKEEYVVKIDPDTRINRTVQFPLAPVFASFRHNGWQGKRILNGPAIGFHRATAKRMIASQWLLDPRFQSTRYAYKRWDPPLLKAGETPSQEWVSLQDEITTEVLEKLQVPIVEWTDVSIKDSSAPFYHP